MKTTATQKGQIVIPAKLRKKYGIKAGTSIRIDDEGDKIVLTPISEEYIGSLKGMLTPGKGKKTALQSLEEERKTDRRKEDEKHRF